MRTIGEVSRALGLKPHVLRYWEEQFPALSPVKRSGSRRYYRPEDIALITQIDNLVHHQGYTLRGARQALSGANEGSDTKAELTEPLSTCVNSNADSSLLDSLKSIRDRLADALKTG